MASYRYRAAIPARELRASINDLSSDMLVFVKPTPEEFEFAVGCGKRVVVDFCDNHFSIFPHYEGFVRLADLVVCPTAEMARIILEETGLVANVIPDPYEFQELLPHCNGDNVLWFGHAINLPSLQRVWDDIPRLTIISNVEWALQWSIETMRSAFIQTDIVIIPATDAYKSANRAVESIRQGCFVVAEPHPSLNDFPGIWIGNIKEGIKWTLQNLQEARQMTRQAQDYVRELYSPKTVASAWKMLLEREKSLSISDAGNAYGMGGSILTDSTKEPIYAQT